MLGISFGSVQSTVKDNLNMSDCLLSEKQKESHINMCQDIQELLDRDPEFISKILTSDETGLYI